MKIRQTDRGFDRADFTDANGQVCSIQKSSSAMEDLIWLGVDSPMVQIMARDADEAWLNDKSDPERHNGWVDVPLPKNALVSGRMHLSQEQVAEILPALQKFVLTGEID